MAVYAESDESVEPQFTSSFKKHATVEGSSNSSLSSNNESPSMSCEAITDTPANISMHSKSSSIGGASAMMRDFDEEDDDDDLEADWSSKITPKVLESMSDVEKKRQEIINEIYITERNHVRNLKLLNEIFLRPLQTSVAVQPDIINIIFPNSMTPLWELHAKFEISIKQRRQEHEFVVQEIGDILLELFENAADEFKTNAAHFCARQLIALDTLRDLRKKNDNFHRFLQIAEAHKACRRLQLKDYLPTVLQRLTKYPLLFDSLLKVTLKLENYDENEVNAITKALNVSKDILNYVNQEIKSSEDMHKLQMIQKKLERSKEYEKEAPVEFKNFDLTQHKLLYDGSLAMKRNPNIQLYCLLFESVLVLLQKQDDNKYILKYHLGQVTKDSQVDGKFNPVIKINLVIVRQIAGDKNSLFIINANPSQIIELTAPSTMECKNWFRHISDASEAFKQRTRAKGDSPQKEKESSDTVSETNPAEKTESIDQPTSPEEKPETLLESSQTPEERPPLSEGPSLSEEQDSEKSDENDRGQQREQILINNSRRLTQQNSLIAPTEIRVTTNEVMVADRVINTEERLKRLDHELRTALLRKQEIVCDMFNVPYNDFQVIVDIAGQTEAPKEPTDLLLAAFAQIQSLTEVVGDHIVANTYREVAAANQLALCDICYRSQVALKNDRNAAMSQCNNSSSATPSTSDAATTIVRAIEDEDGYCEIEEIRSEMVQNNNSSFENSISRTPDTLNNASSPQNSQMSSDNMTVSQPISPCSETTMSGASSRINNSVSIRTCKNNCYNPLVMQPPSAVSCNLISGHLSALSTHFSHLMPLINQREKEREMLRRENQRLREMLNLMNERVLEKEETPAVFEFDNKNYDETDDSEKKDIEVEILEKETFEDAKELLSPLEEEDNNYSEDNNSHFVIPSTTTITTEQQDSSPQEQLDEVDSTKTVPDIESSVVVLPENDDDDVEQLPSPNEAAVPGENPPQLSAEQHVPE